jgi:hypothetical protein
MRACAQAASAGHTRASLLLGKMLLGRRGRAAEARAHLESAADAGFSEARRLLMSQTV